MLGQAIYGCKIALPRPTGNSKGDSRSVTPKVVSPAELHTLNAGQCIYIYISISIYTHQIALDYLRILFPCLCDSLTKIVSHLGFVAACIDNALTVEIEILPRSASKSRPSRRVSM